MARTKQTARRLGRRVPGDRQGDAIVPIPEIDDETAARLKAIEDGEMQAELKHIDRKYTEQGQVYYAETIEEDIPDQINWWSKFALCLVRHTVQGNPSLVQKVSLQINSQHLKDILKDTIKDFPGVSFETKEITIDAPYRVLFHYRHELEAVGDDLDDDSEAAQHLSLLLNFLAEEFKEAIEEIDNLNDQGLINYEYLWTIFRPGTTIFGPVHGQSRAFELKSYEYNFDPPGLYIESEYVDFDGAAMGARTTKRLLPAFSGTKRICDLPAYPLEWHPDAEDKTKQLIARGRRFESLACMGFYHYSGIAIEHGEYSENKYNVSGRVVVDTKTFHRLKADKAFTVSSFKSDGNAHEQCGHIEDENGNTIESFDVNARGEQKPELEPLTDEQCLLATAMARGFSFEEKKWFDFFIDQLSPPNWDTQCFDQLVLPQTQKQLVRALVTTHCQQQDSFDDIVKGKGKGLVMVLHGPPGVGKTLTAETVAEYCQRPLYMVSSGDLGTYSSALDERLSRILDMASTWKAVLLIDEADIFLEQRSLHDLERNSLVSIFLRVLEYYEGILFLTSNRVATFDDAFKSRIHVPLKYSELTAASRKQIWKNFLGQKKPGVDATAGLAVIDEAGYDALARVELNGRQIKNVLRTASSLAQFAGEQLDLAKLQQVITIQVEFERELDTGGVLALP
nr:uncharacterized protein LOC112019614 [Quercus suber]POF16364.1 atpase family aaa domain-containing protein 3b [Quercus suber]